MSGGEPVSLAERRARTRREAAAPDLLAGMAAVVASADALADVLRDVAVAARAAVDGTTAAVAVAADGMLRPVASVGSGSLGSLPAVPLAAAADLLGARGDDADALPPVQWCAALAAARAVTLPLMIGGEAFGVLVVGFAMSSWLPASIVLMGLIGMAQAVYMASNYALLDVLVRDKLAGRV